MEAGASGLPVISYPENAYADSWLHEGDQRMMARDLIAIGRGDVAPRADKTPIPTEEVMSRAMLAVYEAIV
jgi:hypothetical protein